MKVINFHPNGIYETEIEGDDYQNFKEHVHRIVDADNHAKVRHIRTTVHWTSFIICIDYIDEKVVLIFQFHSADEYDVAWDTMEKLNYINN